MKKVGTVTAFPDAVTGFRFLTPFPALAGKATQSSDYSEILEPSELPRCSMDLELNAAALTAAIGSTATIPTYIARIRKSF